MPLHIKLGRNFVKVLSRTPLRSLQEHLAAAASALPMYSCRVSMTSLYAQGLNPVCAQFDGMLRDHRCMNTKYFTPVDEYSYYGSMLNVALPDGECFDASSLRGMSKVPHR